MHVELFLAKYAERELILVLSFPRSHGPNSHGTAVLESLNCEWVGQPGCKTEVLKMSFEAELGPLNQSIGGAKGQIGRNMKNFAI